MTQKEFEGKLLKMKAEYIAKRTECDSAIVMVKKLSAR